MKPHRCSPIRRLFLLVAIATAAAAAMSSRRRTANVGGESAPQPASMPTWTPVDPGTTNVGGEAAPRPVSTPTLPTTAKKAPAKKAPAKKAAATKKAAERAWREPGKDGACPKGYPVKVAASGIFHLPGGRGYERTTPVRCYVDAAAAKADGYRQAKA